MKYIKIAAIILLLMNLFNLPAWALTTTRLTTVPARLTDAPTKAAERQDARLTNIQTRADQMIAERIATLQKLLTHVTTDAHLPSADVTTFTTEINDAISALQTLKTKIDADTDYTTARADTKSIVTNFRIYLIFEPKLRLLIAVDNLTTTTQKLASLSANLTSLISSLKLEGKDVTTMQAALDDMNAKLEDASTQLGKANTMLNSINISQAGQQPFVSIKQDLANVRQDLAAVRADLAKIKSGVKASSPTTHPTETIHPTESTSSAK